MQFILLVIFKEAIFKEAIFKVMFVNHLEFCIKFLKQQRNMYLTQQWICYGNNI
jgi:hypothetical protein